MNEAPATPEGLALLVRHRAWAYLSSITAPSQIAAVAEDLFRLPRGELRRLASVHLGVLPETGEMLDAAEYVLRELPSSVARSEVELRGAVRLPVAWAETLVRRQVTADRSLFVCRPAERRYDTPLARLVKLALAQCGGLAEGAALATTGTTGSLLARRAERAGRLSQHTKLRDVRLVRAISTSAMRGALRVRGAAPIVNFINMYREAIEDQSPRTTRDVVTRQLLVPERPDKLFELYVGFQLIDAFIANGYVQTRPRLFPHRRLPFAHLKATSGRDITIWYQRALARVLGSSVDGGRYADALVRAGLSKQPLRPDFVLVREPGGEVLVVEVKFSEREGESPDRVGIRDVLGYLHDAEHLLGYKPRPRSLVVGWNSRGQPAPADIVVANQSGIAAALAMTTEEWAAARRST